MSKIFSLTSLLFIGMLARAAQVNQAVKIGPHVHYFVLEGTIGSKSVPGKGDLISNITEGVQIDYDESDVPQLEPTEQN